MIGYISTIYMLMFHIAILHTSTASDAKEGTPVKSLPVLVNADGLPLGVNLSKARDTIALDGQVLVSLPTAANDTLILKVTALDERCLYTFSSFCVIKGSTSDYVYQVTVIDDDKGQGFVNLCGDNLRGLVYTSKLCYSIVPVQEGVEHEVTSIPLPMMVPALTEASKALEKTASSVMKQRCIDLLVVADHTIREWHAGQDVECYTLTMTSLASIILNDSSLGQPIELVIKKLVILQQADSTLEIVPNMAHNAKTFIQWKNKYGQQMNESYDLALLLTRVDLKFGPNDHTGHATNGGICQPDKNGILVEDRGLISSYTIVHQIGHSLGLGHDGEDDNDCIDRTYIMSAINYTSAQSPYWSSCSRKKLDELFRNEPYHCLDNKPATVSPNRKPSPDHKPSPLPGKKHGQDKKCHLRHGPSASSCNKNENRTSKDKVKNIIMITTLLCISGVAIPLASGVVLLLYYLIKKRSATRNGYTEIDPNGLTICTCQCCNVVKRLIGLD